MAGDRVRIKILDNSPAVKDLLKKLIDASETEKATSAEWYSNPEDFLESYESDKDNLIFIKLGGIFNGLEIARKINAMDKSARFIFFSNSELYALDAYQLYPVGFLLEPIEFDQLKEVLERYSMEYKMFPQSS